MRTITLNYRYMNTQPRMTRIEKAVYATAFVAGTVKKIAKVSSVIVKEDMKQLKFDLKTF